MIPAALLLLGVITVTAGDPPPSRQVLMAVEEHERIAGELSRELGLTTLELEKRDRALKACEAKLQARAPEAIEALVLPPVPAEDETRWTGLEVLGMAGVGVAVGGLLVGSVWLVTHLESR